MRNIIFLGILSIFLSLFSSGCFKDSVAAGSKYKIPIVNHDLSYIPYDAKVDQADFVICDSTDFRSGRNGIQYIGGSNKLREDINSNFVSNKKYETFNGYVVIRFLVNCEGKSGRYRTQSLNLDFSPVKAPSGLLSQTTQLIKNLDTWEKHSLNDSRMEFSKFINLKFNNGQIQHILL